MAYFHIQKNLPEIYKDFYFDLSIIIAKLNNQLVLFDNNAKSSFRYLTKSLL